MQIQKQASTQPQSSDCFEEEWKVKINTGGVYTLSKNQALVLKQAIANGNRGIIVFQSFSVSIPYIAEFYRNKRYLKDSKQLTARAKETEFVPISDEKFEEFRKRAYKKIGK